MTVDLLSDAAAVDQGDDLGSPIDTIAGDASPTKPCTLPATAIPWKPAMLICKLPTGTTTNQCSAAQYCNAPGWHLCTATEYLASGGKLSSPPDNGEYWLAACVRQADDVFYAADVICEGGCVWVSGATLTDAWSCPPFTSSLASTLGPLGLMTLAQCYRVGIDTPTTEGYWKPRRTDVQLYGVVCCK